MNSSFMLIGANYGECRGWYKDTIFDNFIHHLTWGNNIIFWLLATDITNG